MNNLVIGLKSSFYENLARLVYGTKRVECSEVMYMDGRIKSLIFTPSHYEMRPSGLWGNDIFNGDSSLNLFAKIPDQYFTIFNSERGAITLQTEEAFKRFENHEGELVTISYYEIFQSVYNKKTNELMKLLDVSYKILNVNFK